ncbi:MAG: class I SAM-dependent methyltransferase, partial [Candidatus Omnitrophica bacterium]|nr:class I SAM-dependent methyltransferase [Candidatus Omnitrophota bacterium]
MAWVSYSAYINGGINILNNMIQEEQRIKQVYAGYAIKRSLKKKWNAKTPGNLFLIESRNSFLKQIIRTKLDKPFDQLKALDIGCGSGDLLNAFFESGFKAENLYGVDLIPQRLDKAKLRQPNFQLACLNAEKLNFSAKKFDLVVFFTVFSSVLDKSMAVNLAQEAKRVLKDKGIIIIYDL